MNIKKLITYIAVAAILLSFTACGKKEEFTGTISGQGSQVHIKTVLVGGITNTRSMSFGQDNYVIDWNNLPRK